MEDTSRERFRRALKEIKNLPTLPGIITKLTAMAEDPDTTTEQMGRVISRDHILAAKLLKLVNSAFYGFPQRIGSLDSAIILLGFNVIKSLIVSASIFEFMEEQDVELWEHSLGCAVVCNVLAKRLGIKEPEEVSTAGLIHDLGKVAIKMELPLENETINEMVHDRQIHRVEAELAVLGLSHAEAGGWLARSWNLPAKLVDPIRNHHSPNKSDEDQLICAIVHFADIMIRGLGYGHGDDIWVPAVSNRAWRLLDLSPEDLDQVLQEVEEKLWDVKGFSLEVQCSTQEPAVGGGGDTAAE